MSLLKMFFPEKWCATEIPGAAGKNFFNSPVTKCASPY
jgi:hypothetical protein